MVTLKEKLTDQVAGDLLKELGKDDLVHILLDMVDPVEILKTIILTRAEQDRMERLESTTTGHRQYPRCFECKSIHKVLKEVLLKHQLNESDILCINK